MVNVDVKYMIAHKSLRNGIYKMGGVVSILLWQQYILFESWHAIATGTRQDVDKIKDKQQKNKGLYSTVQRF